MDLAAMVDCDGVSLEGLRSLGGEGVGIPLWRWKM
jgi:hypothetical protein